MAKQAEAERERRAKIIHAQGEFEASQKLAAAAEIIAKQPSAIHLRFLQSLVQVAAENNQTLVLPVPIDIIRNLMDYKRSSLRLSGDNRRVRSMGIPALFSAPMIYKDSMIENFQELN